MDKHLNLFADLQGAVCFVSGASSGFGAHFVEILARRGAHVAAGARRVPALEALCARLDGCHVLPVQLDVTDPASVESAVRRAEEWAGSAVEVLVNNAGVSVEKLALDQDQRDWDLVQDTNLRGCFLLARACARRMVATETPGRIVNISSVLGLGVQKLTVGYATSKAGLIQMTRVLALELAKHDIRVNCIAPGFVVTDITRHIVGKEGDETAFGKHLLRRTPVRRFGRASDMDGALLLLCSARTSAFITGTTLTVDGGLLVSSL